MSKIDLLTTAEAAELLRVHPQTILDWVSEGALPALRLASKTIRIRRDDLDAFLAAASTDGEATT